MVQFLELNPSTPHPTRSDREPQAEAQLVVCSPLPGARQSDLDDLDHRTHAMRGAWCGTAADKTALP